MAIIKYRVEARMTDTESQEAVIESVWRYEEVHNPNKEGKELTRSEAVKAIKEQGLVKVHQTPYGAIWDTPDEPMWNRYHGKFFNKS